MRRALWRMTASVVLPAPAGRVWELLLRKDTFLYVTRGMVACTDAERWPATPFAPGAVLATRVRVFGWGPATHHEIRIVRVDAARCEIETEEGGGLVRVWKHRLRVEPVAGAGSRLTDAIELQAGLLTPAVWLFAAAFYRYRHWRWRRWLRIRAGDAV